MPLLLTDTDIFGHGHAVECLDLALQVLSWSTVLSDFTACSPHVLASGREGRRTQVSDGQNIPRHTQEPGGRGRGRGRGRDSFFDDGVVVMWQLVMQPGAPAWSCGAW